MVLQVLRGRASSTHASSGPPRLELRSLLRLGVPALLSALFGVALLAPAAGALPDNRAWELVSPTEKFGGRIEPITEEGGVTQSSEDGKSLTYVADSPLVSEPDGNASLNVSQVFASRLPSGAWTTKDVATPHDEATGLIAGYLAEYLYFSSTLSTGLVLPRGETPLSPDATEATIYLRALPDGTPTYTPLVSPKNVSTGEHFGFKLEFAGSSPDLKHVIVRSEVPLNAEPPEGSIPTQLYEWTAGQLELVSLLPNGEAATVATLGSKEGGFNVDGAVSDDGIHVFWTNGPSFSEEHLYATDMTTHKTVQVDVAQGVAEPAAARTEFQGATPNGEYVYFTDEFPLVPGASASGNDLYQYDTTTGDLADLSVDPNAGEEAAVLGHILGFGEGAEGDSVYYIARGALTSVPNSDSESAVDGEPNVYMTTVVGGVPTTRFIARVAPGDTNDWDERGSVDSHLDKQPTRVSPNGGYLTFMSQRALAGYDNVDAVTGESDEEVYLFDAKSSHLTCVSCDPSGLPPHGVVDQESAGEGLGLLVDRPRIWEGFTLAGNVPGWTAASKEYAFYQSRYLNNNGQVFFNTSEALVPADTNEKEDVYEYEPSGVGTCTSATGCVSLLSAGTSDSESAFMDASDSGDDVFFLTTSRLSTADADTSFDIYDAQVCGATTPCYVPPSASVNGPCTSSSICRPEPPPGNSAAGLPATMAALGEGNVSAPSPTAIKKPVALTRAQKLKRALQVCARYTKKTKKAACRAKAKAKYGPVKARSKRKTGGKKG